MVDADISHLGGELGEPGLGGRVIIDGESGVGIDPSGMDVGVVGVVVVVCSLELVVAAVVVVAWSPAGTPRPAAVVDVTSGAVAVVEVALVVGVPGRVVVGPDGGAVVVEVGGAKGF